MLPPSTEALCSRALQQAFARCAGERPVAPDGQKQVWVGRTHHAQGLRDALYGRPTLHRPPPSTPRS